MKRIIHCLLGYNSNMMMQAELLPAENLKYFLLHSGMIHDVQLQLDINQYSNGFSNLTYLLKIEGKEFVLRRPPVGAVKRGHDMSREFKVLTGLEKGFDMAPKPLCYCEDTSVIGGEFYLMEKIEGIILTAEEAVKREVDEASFSKISETWIQSFLDLHAVPYQEFGLDDLGKPEGYVERQVVNWAKQYRKAATMAIPEVDKLIPWLEENQPKKYEHCFIHNDFKYDNVVFADDSWKRIRAILDWEMCTLGDPLMDLGTSLSYWMQASDGPAAKIIPSPTLLPGNPSRDEIVHLYALKSGRNLDNIVFYYAFGLFKFAVIAQQIFYRFHLGLTKNQKFAQLDKACQVLCQMSWQAIQKNRIENIV